MTVWEGLLQERPLETFDYPCQRLLPAISSNLAQRSGVPEQARLRTAYLRSWATNQTLRKAAAEAVEALDQGGVECLLLKGVALGAMVYQDPGLRPATDVDLLVRRRDASAALEILRAAGWAGPPRIRPDDGLENAVGLRRGGVALDLHWALLREARRPEADQTLWERSVATTLEGRPARALCPDHLLFHLLVVADREPYNLARYLLDIHFLRQRFAGQLDARHLHDLLRQRYLLHRLSRLPLAQLGWSELIPAQPPSLLDKVWSELSRCLQPGVRAEWTYALFPLLDYGINYRGPGRSVGSYLRGGVHGQSWQDVARRVVSKLRRMLGRS